MSPLGDHDVPTDHVQHEDKYKAPTHPHVRPLSLQDEGGRCESFLDSVGKNCHDFSYILYRCFGGFAGKLAIDLRGGDVGVS